ncbi:hypothetical protein EE612_003880, partial [Oryza sativa]
LKLLVDKRLHRVLYAKALKDAVDFLIGLLRVRRGRCRSPHAPRPRCSRFLLLESRAPAARRFRAGLPPRRLQPRSPTDRRPSTCSSRARPLLAASASATAGSGSGNLPSPPRPCSSSPRRRTPSRRSACGCRAC